MAEPVDVWIAQLQPAFVAACTAEDRDRAARFASPAAAEHWLASRGILRTILAAEVGATIDFEEGLHGKPQVAGHPEVHFNLSHSGDVAAVAVAAVAVGIDIEAPRRLRNRTALGRRLLGPDWSGSDDELLKHWTRVEALLKAEGTGIGGGTRDALTRLGADGWTVRDLMDVTPYLGAVAARGDWVVRRRQCDV